jgi:uncharacterized protein YjbI with pentapeptide repeats
MGKKRSAPPAVDWQVQRFAGKTFAFGGKLRKRDFDQATEMIKGDGGKLVSEVSPTLDYLVLGSGRQVAQLQKQVKELNQAGQARIQVLALDEFFAQMAPGRDLAVALLRAGEEGATRWRLLTRWSHAAVDLSGMDLRGLKLEGNYFFNIKLDGTDLRQAEFTRVSLYCPVSGVRFDGAQLSECSFKGLIDCRLVDANLQNASFYHAALERTDFTGANLEEARLHGAQTSAVSFQRANLKRAWIGEVRLVGANLAEADLTRANLTKSDLAGASLNHANLTEADLFQANLKGADLRNACLRWAILAEADLTDAQIEGADFEGANLYGAKMDGLDLSQARGLETVKPLPVAGKHLRELDRVAGQCGRLKTTAAITLTGDASVPVEVLSANQGRNISIGSLKYSVHTPTSIRTASVGMLTVVRPWLHGSLRLDSIKVTATGAPLKPKALRELVLAAWCEACGRDVPAGDQIRTAVAQDQQREEERLANVLKDLRGGPEGIQRWNARTTQQRQHAGPFRKIDLSTAQMDGVNLSWNLDFRGANLAGASLVGAELSHWSRFQQACFCGADLTGADLGIGQFRKASFENAVLRKGKLRVAVFLEANLRGADLTGADLYHANLRGADLSGATLTRVNLEHAKFDEKTLWPAGFVPPDGMYWQGTGPDPRRQPRQPPRPVAVKDLPSFMARLRQTIDPGRLGNALEMLCSDRFQLFSQVEEGSLIGVVRSQSDPDLVYSCRLAGDGSYSCCTQNLHVCGGLRGALCKHLLVLIVGLARAEKLDLAAVDRWIEASQKKKPVHDRDSASTVFLRYKGAETGEVDWRPTETVPEDFYAF